MCDEFCNENGPANEGSGDKDKQANKQKSDLFQKKEKQNVQNRCSTLREGFECRGIAHS